MWWNRNKKRVVVVWPLLKMELLGLHIFWESIFSHLSDYLFLFVRFPPASLFPWGLEGFSADFTSSVPLCRKTISHKSKDEDKSLEARFRRIWRKVQTWPCFVIVRFYVFFQEGVERFLCSFFSRTPLWRKCKQKEQSRPQKVKLKYPRTKK